MFVDVCFYDALVSKPLSSVRLFGLLSACLSAGYGVLFTLVGDFRAEYGIGETSVGLIISVGFMSAFVGQVFLAPIGDRGHARQLVVAGTMLNVIGLLMMAFGGTFPLVLAGRVVSGLGIGAATPAIKRIVILADPDNLGRNLGLLLSADVFGFAMGPAVSAVLVGPFGLPAPFVVVAAASTVVVSFALRVRVDESDATARHPLALDLLRSKAVAGAVLLGSTSFLMIGAFDVLWDVVHEDLGTQPWLANLGITLFALPLVLLGPVGGSLAQRIGPFRVGAVGLLVAAGFMASYGFVPSGTWIFSIAMGHAITDGLTIAAPGIAVGLAAPEGRQAGAQGLIGAGQAVFAAVTALVIGGTYEQFGRAVAYPVAAIGMLICTTIALWLAREVWVRRTPTVAFESSGQGPESSSSIT